MTVKPDRSGNVVPIDPGFVRSSLVVLIQAVSSFFGTNPIVLIDEYDHLIISAHENKFRVGFSQVYSSFLTEALKGNVKQYYNGYLFGNTRLYNPWSVLSYVDKQILKSYWVNTSTNSLIRESILSADRNFKRLFGKLIEEGEAVVSLNLEAAFVELEKPVPCGGFW
ncbi:MAG: hypothetical protein FWF59_07025 [Turicibacter sp.]|nr:hypothetical protein [Turicibacter sp.]